jgi:hypothetical protein
MAAVFFAGLHPLAEGHLNKPAASRDILPARNRLILGGFLIGCRSSTSELT